MFFRYALIYVILSSLIWLAYHFTVLEANVARLRLITLLTSSIIILSMSISLYFLTYTKFYRIHTTFVSIITVVMLCGTSLALLEFMSIEMFSPLGHFSICIEIILLIYTMIPLRLWQNCAFAAIYSILFEIGTLRSSDANFNVSYKILIMRCLLHVCVHLVGFHILIMNVVRMRGTFIEVGQNLLGKCILNFLHIISSHFHHNSDFWPQKINISVSFSLLKFYLVKRQLEMEKQVSQIFSC